MTQMNSQGGILRPDEVARAQYEMNQSMSGGTSGSGSGGSGGSEGSGGGSVKPGDKIEAKDAMFGTQSGGGMVKPGDKVEAQSEMFKGNQ